MKSKQTDNHSYILSIGWTYDGSCNCDGRHTEKYKLKTELGEYKIRLSYSSFLISTPSQRFKRYKLKELKPIIDEIFQNHSADIQKKNKVQGISK